jgi:hypothetical protein
MSRRRRRPTLHRSRIEPLSVDAVEALTDAIPGRYRTLTTLAAGPPSTHASGDRR